MSKIVNRWNKEKHEYVEHHIPENWNVKTYSIDMNEIVNCVCCGKEMRFGDGYTSRRFHSKVGFGYCECEKCYFSYKE